MTTPPTSLYRPYFTPEECRLLDELARRETGDVPDLSSEINLLRILLARVFARSGKWAASQPDGPKAHYRLLSAYARAVEVIALLTRLTLQYRDPFAGFREDVELGKDLARLEHGVYDYLKYSDEDGA